MPNTPTNESNDAYERRMAAGKLLVEAPQGAVFEYKNSHGIYFACGPDEAAAFVLAGTPVRVAPTPKKVLRKAWEILREAQAAGKVKLYGREVLIVVSNLGFEVALKYIVEAEGADRETVNSEWPDEWFTEAAPK